MELTLNEQKGTIRIPQSHLDQNKITQLPRIKIDSTDLIKDPINLKYGAKSISCGDILAITHTNQGQLEYKSAYIVTRILPAGMHGRIRLTPTHNNAQHITASYDSFKYYNTYVVLQRDNENNKIRPRVLRFINPLTILQQIPASNKNELTSKICSQTI